ncbi:hypothetical protein AC1031_005659 [Aphanomyces cochlioides]|nr:hypothetical protein AC1031_005659 [Aphanomyces cochlioides]
MRLLHQLFVAAVFSVVRGAIVDTLAKCPADVSNKYTTKLEAQIKLCQAAMNAPPDVLLTDTKFCTKDECTQLVKDAVSWTCQPNTSDLIPTNYCNQTCQELVPKMQDKKLTCDKVNNGSIVYCPICTEFSNAAEGFIATCGVWDSAESLIISISSSTKKCNDYYGTPVPTTAKAVSSSTTYIVVGVVGGVVVLSVIGFYCLRKKRSSKDGDYRSDSQFNSMCSRRPGTNSGGSSTNAQMTMQNDIRFDPALSQFRIPQQDIQNISLLVKGGYGVVFHATFGKIDVAMKQLLPSKAKDPNAIQDFMNEIRLCARLEHPKIVKFVGISWSTLQDLAVLSEFMTNGDVTGLIRKERKKPENQRMVQWFPRGYGGPSKTAIAADVIDALVYLHSFQPTVIHRDLKSKNVLLSDTWEAKLSDFGISRVTSLEESMTSNIGTVAWIAPEVLTGGRYTEKADIYSFGVLLSELDTLQVPYAEMLGKSTENGFSNARLAMMVSEGSLKPSFTEGMPEKLLSIAHACLSFQDVERPSAMQLSYQLHKILKEFRAELEQEFA